MTNETEIVPNTPKADGTENKRGKWIRGAINAAGGAIPFAGGLLSAAASVWGESEAEKTSETLRAWIKMLEDELREKQRTIVDILSRIDMHEEKISERVKSSDYQHLLKKAFRNWAGTESEKKQAFVRNILTNAASTEIVSDDVVALFLEWLHNYSEFHFLVIGELYRNPGSTRGDIWRNLGRNDVREDSADADLFKLLIRDLSTGGIIRQHRETDYVGNFILKPRAQTQTRPNLETKTAKSAFDDGESYELTSLGQQFVHYAMTELTIKLTYRNDDVDESGFEVATTSQDSAV